MQDPFVVSLSKSLLREGEKEQNRTKRGLGRPEITSFFIRTTWAGGRKLTSPGPSPLFQQRDAGQAEAEGFNGSQLLVLA